MKKTIAAIFALLLIATLATTGNITPTVGGIGEYARALGLVF